MKKIYYVDKNERYLQIFTSCIIEKNRNPFELKKEKKRKLHFARCLLLSEMP